MTAQQKEIQERFKAIGAEDYKAGMKCIPITSPRVHEFIRENSSPNTQFNGTIATACKAWSDGWIYANLKAPLDL
jgi:hypothetical protein